jgi:hypothetical protein
MIGFISTSVISSLHHTYYNAIADLLNLQFNVTHAIGFSVFTSRLPASNLNTQKLALQIAVKSSYQFLFSHPGTTELN